MDIMNCPISFWQRKARRTSKSHNQELLTFKDSFEEKQGKRPVQSHLFVQMDSHSSPIPFHFLKLFKNGDRKGGKPQPTTLWEQKKKPQQALSHL